MFIVLQGHGTPCPYLISNYEKSVERAEVLPYVLALIGEDANEELRSPPPHQSELQLVP
jgi:hypothetical protein